MLSALLVFCLVQSGTPVEATAVNPHSGLSELTVPQLLARMPKDPWIGEGDDTRLAPEVVELQRRVEGGALRDDDWRAALVQAGVIHTRPRWPVDEPLRVWMRQPEWLRRATISARAVEPALGEAKAGNTHGYGCGTQLAMQRRRLLSALPAGTTRVRFVVTIEQFVDPESPKAEQPMRRLWSGELSIPIEAVASFDEALPPSASAAETDDVRRSFCAWWEGASPSLSFGAGGEHEDFPQLREVGLSLDVEVRCRGVVRGRERIVVSEWVYPGMRTGARFGECRPILADVDFSPNALDPSGWTLHVSGARENLLTVWEADRWWNGEFDITLTEALAKGPPWKDLLDPVTGQSKR